MQEIDFRDIELNADRIFAENWGLLAAGDKSDWNCMTISWGMLGSIWGQGWGEPSCIVFVRPQRYTKIFMDRSVRFSISFFPRSNQEDLRYLGSHSRWQVPDKVEHTCLTPDILNGEVVFKETVLTLVCRKLYQQTMKEECFIDQDTIKKWYPLKDFHDLYIARIEKTLIPDGSSVSDLKRLLS